MNDEELAQAMVDYLRGLDDYGSPYVGPVTLSEVMVDGWIDFRAFARAIRQAIEQADANKGEKRA